MGANRRDAAYTYVLAFSAGLMEGRISFTDSTRPWITSTLCDASHGCKYILIRRAE